MGLEALRRVQIGLESTRGTAVAADVKLMGMLTMDPTQVLYMPEDEERQSLALLHRREIVAEMANMHFESSLNFEQLIHFLAMGVGNHGSQPTTPTNGVLTRDWLFEPSHSASNAQAAYTLEYGDDQQEYESAFVMCSQLEFTWALEESVKMSAELFGRSVTKATFTSLSDPVARRNSPGPAFSRRHSAVEGEREAQVGAAAAAAERPLQEQWVLGAPEAMVVIPPSRVRLMVIALAAEEPKVAIRMLTAPMLKTVEVVVLVEIQL